MARKTKKAPRVKRLHIKNVALVETKGWGGFSGKFTLSLCGDDDAKEAVIDLDMWDAKHIIDKLREKMRETKKSTNNLFDSVGV